MLIPHQKLTVRSSDLLAGAFGVKDNISRFVAAGDYSWLASGRAAIRAVLEKNGAETVLVPRFTCSVVLDAVKMAGAKPVFSEDEDFDAMILAHNFGFFENPEKAQKLCRKKDAILIEDCAQALGAKYKGRVAGSFGDYAIYSFGISKNIGFCGAMVNSDIKIGNNVPKTFVLGRVLRSLAAPFVLHPHIYSRRMIEGELKKSYPPLYYDLDGYSRNIVQSIAGRYDSILKTRTENAKYCMEELDGVVDFMRPIKDSEPAWLYFILLDKEREVVRKKLLKKGVDVQPLLSFRDLSDGVHGNDHLAFALYRPRWETERIVEAIKEVSK